MQLVKDQSSIFEIYSLAICINIKTIIWFNRKQLNILKTFLKYMEFILLPFKDGSSLKVV